MNEENNSTPSGRPLRLLVMGSLGILAGASVLLLVLPYAQLYPLAPEPELAAPTIQQARGRDRYVSLGCVYCHSQQPRDASMGPDSERGWGRPSTPGDYYYDYPHQLGTMRTGPDLFNVAARQDDPQWHYVHLYNPRLVSDYSIMPSYPFLFDVVDEPDEGAVVVDLPASAAPDDGVVVATAEAQDLVAYLLSLDHTYPSIYLPEEEEVSDE